MARHGSYSCARGYQDADCGLYYLQARYYDPSTQQFLSQDPLRGLTGPACTHACGSPMKATDPA